MQFYLDGYRPGDPFVQQPHPSVAGRTAELPETTDVLVVGSGPAGLLLAAQLAQFPELRTVVVDRRDGPLAVGQADGVACRTVEVFETLGLANRLVHEGYRVNEVTFWRSGDDGIVRTGRIDDVEEGLSEMPHVIVNQARMLSYLRDHMRRSATRAEPCYGKHVTDVEVDPDPAAEYPVTVTLQHMKDFEPTGETSTIRARYVVGCDGSRSATRQSMGLELRGEAADQSWGVLDVLATTDFPDIRLKSAIHSEHGSILIIPREGGYLVRLYIELDNDRDGEMLRDRTVTPEKLTAVANRILHPYTIDVKHVGWWTVYEIGQRLCDRFDDNPDNPRVFIAGDACHTHSAKAGQGMNVSIADAWNLGWKLATVLRGTSRPEILRTYSTERQAVAQRLIDFDREFTTLFSGRDEESERFPQYFREQGRFTAGVSVQYGPSSLTASSSRQELATGFPLGMRFHSAPVVRLADAKPMHLGHAARADGAWRLYAFADPAHPAAANSRLRAFARSVDVLAARFTPAGADPDSVLDFRAILQQGHRSVTVADLPPALLPHKGTFGLTDYEKVFCPDPAADVFDLRGVDRAQGCVVVVRPDQYVAHVLPLDAPGELAEFLEGVLVAQVISEGVESGG
ncbi:3-hydroxybenzoate 4-monooxygenase [Amycolatopsis sp. K13G38]|uniref:3-hydroxybenzoate 4-monooxygenase n=1 Tax=Amycolatopsis acididurans TaxID=2724524 RepID=A0ABX1J3H5_9PSEU|nr:FAD-dependent monooxygenase [Amycolatopsis acididurans]NKQ54336.1 3-hydroxybenzoate 4-monooxygenase [Amycolatopsis acididurans]